MNDRERKRNMDKQVKLGEAVVYVNPVGIPRPALVIEPRMKWNR